VYRVSVYNTCDVWSRITIKQRFFWNEYSNEIYFYGMKEESLSKDMDIFSFGLIFRHQLRCDSDIILLTCVCNVLCSLHYQMLYCIKAQDRRTTGIAVC